jgi:hypothetical protein
MPAQNEGTVIFDLRDAYGHSIRGDVSFGFRNLKAPSMNFLHQTQLPGEALPLQGVPASPFGKWQVDITIKRFRFKSVFVDVSSNDTTTVAETFFIKPSEATPVFPSTEEISNLERWRPLASVFDPAQYNGLEAQQKAGLLNLFAKMSDPSTPEVFSDVLQVFKVKPARIYARVRPALLEKVLGLSQRFHEQPDGGSLHTFLDDWVRLGEHASFKTPDKMGNLQLTFATNPHEEFAVDADLDDHQGLQHAFDVIKHKFSGDTNPYDIHEVLVKFQGIDPGYRLY